MKSDKTGELAHTDTTINTLCETDIAEVMELFCRCFWNDPYYTKLFPDNGMKQTAINETFRQTILYCIAKGSCLGVRKSGKLIGFIVCFDYKNIRAKDNQLFHLIFADKDSAEALPYYSTLHTTVANLPGTVIYCLSLAVDPAYRHLGIASAMWDCVMNMFPGVSFATDVSNSASLGIYLKRNFNIQQLDKDYYLLTYS